MHFDTHGGSMRYFFSKQKKNKSNELIKYINIENNFNIKNNKIYLEFMNKSQKICDDLKKFVLEKINLGFTVAGYGATAKSTTTLNYMKMDSKFISYIYDSTPFKIGKLTPGTHIPIRDSTSLIDDKPDYTILFAWNHKNEILKKEKLNGSQTKWIEYIPEINILDEY